MNINEIEPKVDSAEKLAAVANVPTSEVLFADEINAIVDGIKRLNRLDRETKQVVLYNKIDNFNSVTLTTAPIIVKSCFAPANSLPPICSLQFFMRTVVTFDIAETLYMQVYVATDRNEIGNLIASTYINDASAPVTNVLKRNVIIEDGALRYPTNFNLSEFQSDEIYVSENYMTGVAFDTTKDNYFHFALRVKDSLFYQNNCQAQINHAQIILTPLVVEPRIAI